MRSWVWDRCLILLEEPWEAPTSATFAAEEVAGSCPLEVAQTCFAAASLEEDRLRACLACWDCACLGSSEAAQGSWRAVAATFGLLPSVADGVAV